MSDCCDSINSSPPGSSVHGISQARILEWVAIAFSRGSSPTRDQARVPCIGGWILYRLNHQGSSESVSHSVVFSCVRLFGIPWTAACRAPLSMGFYSPLRRLERAVIPFSRGSSQFRDGTQVSCIAGGFFTIWATRGPWGRYAKCSKSEEDKYYMITLICEILKRKSKTRSQIQRTD